ncbi:MAG TPA: hypothetical protein VFB84_22450 [Micromonosporaceae bacterium]|nr:hypothetical protein [Micromonosporaceae bacterium]
MSPAPTRIAALTASIAVIFVPLAFSEELLEPFFYFTRREWVVPPGVLLMADTGLLVAAFLLARWGHGGDRPSTFRPLWFIGGAIAHLGVDVAAVQMSPSVAAGVALAVPYVATLAVIGAAVAGARWLPRWPRRWPALRRRSVPETGRTHSGFRYVLPLVVGTLFAYLGETVYWYTLGADPTTGARVVNDEYFAQMSAVIPLLLIAIGFEARQFQVYRRHPAGRATAIVIVLLLCVAEVLVLAALSPESTSPLQSGPASIGPPARGLPAWLEYPAFVLSLEAMCMGLALVAWALTSAAQTTRAGATDAEPPANATLPISGTATTTPGVTAPDTGRTEGGAYPRSSRIAPTLLVSAGWAAATAFVWWHRRTRR